MITLVLGGTRSGKSEVAERIAANLPDPVTYVATAPVDDGDPDFAARVAAHRSRRPASWSTVEASEDLAVVLAGTLGTAIVDSVGTWIARHSDFAVDVRALCDACVRRDGDTVLVSEEVGLAVHAPTEVGRRFADAVGECNRGLATVADRVLLVVAGRTIELASFDA